MTLISYMWVEVQQIYEQNLKIIAMIHETITLHWHKFFHLVTDFSLRKSLSSYYILFL